MSSRFNTFYLGEPSDAADALEEDATLDELRAALQNALRRIARLQYGAVEIGNQVAALRKDLNE